MGQQPSTHASIHGEQRTSQPQASNDDENVPYTGYSHPKPSDSPKALTQSLPVYNQQRGGITVVNPHPDASWRSTKPIELQKLDKVHRFWPILRSSIDTIPPQEKITDGVHYKEILSLCVRYQEHLSEAAGIVGTEQKALASRLKDIEMFSAGIVQQMIRRQEKMQRTNVHLQKVSEVERALTNIKATLDSCVPLVQRLNKLLPEEVRLEGFKFNPDVESDNDDERDDGRGQSINEDSREFDALRTL